ncbi:MAG: M23 family metallopeptidase [Clostridia bacterium]|nr:M23 family metallopeptidase [Clostridia bacterium]
MRAALKYDLESYEASRTDDTVKHAPFVTLIALAATKYGGDFSRCKASDIQTFAERLMAGEAPEDIAASSKTFPYFLEAYEAALGGFVGNYAVQTDAGLSKRYGLKVFSPIAAGYSYSDYDDFGAARSYGYRRPHLGHDMMGSVGTPIIAVESGYVEACGWNQYGGWRIGIRSFDGKRYYYYAHLRKDHPYNDIYEGKIVTAGEVIGYLGMTGYSAKENVNNIDTPHLHFGVQLIFDSSQKDGWNQIWLDLWEYTRFLQNVRSAVYYDKESGEFYPKNPILDLDIPD